MLKDSFYRPNLRYEVIYSSTKDDSEKIAELIKTDFKGQSGIIYCLTVKEVDELAKRLVANKIRACPYHAQLDPTTRKKYQEAWYNGVVLVIVATIAFGMGINKMDVRFVIHYSMSKSLENYYQETGRAGRDGKEAKCILYYRFQDAFRATSLFFAEANALKIIYQMIKFCYDRMHCRKKQLAQYFGDADCACNKMCDNCCNSYIYKEIDASQYYKDMLRIMECAERVKERVTPLKMIEAWTGKGSKKIRPDGLKKPEHPRQICESILINLVLEGYLKEEFHFTPYSTISYIVPGYNQLYKKGPVKIKICVPGERRESDESSHFRNLINHSGANEAVNNHDINEIQTDESDPIVPTPKRSKRPTVIDDDDESSNEIICDSVIQPTTSRSDSPILLD